MWKASKKDQKECKEIAQELFSETLPPSTARIMHMTKGRDSVDFLYILYCATSKHILQIRILYTYT